MKARKLISFAVLSLLVFTGSNSYAAQKSQSLPGESRLKFFNYQPNTVYEYTGFLKYASRIDFDPSEKIQTITMGDPTGWQLNPSGSTLFIKPTEVGATTNMVLFTNKRIYYFEVYSKEAEAIDDSELVFATKFNYTDGSAGGGDAGFVDLSSTNSGKEAEKSYVPDPVKDAAMLNFNYTMSGSKKVAPIEVFDDGEFTYFKFKDINQDYPAIFQVLPDGNEGLINFRVSREGYVVVEMVTSQYTLRFGNEMVCIFNEKMPLERTGKKKKDKGTSFFGVF